MRCIHCNAETENIINGECVCLNCMNKLYASCENCGELHEKEKMTETNVGLVCSECLESDFICCYDCGEWFQVDNIHMVRNRYNQEAYVCDDCCANNYIYCPTCEEYCHYSIGTDSTFDGQWRCYTCLDNVDDFIYCRNCDTYYRECDMTYNEAQDEWLCPNCYEEAEEDDSVIQSYHSGHKDGLHFYECPHERAQNQQLYYGIELEVENIIERYDIETIADEALQVFDPELWHCESDGSLCDGCEFISQPMTFEYLNSPRIEHKIKSALALLSDKGARSYNTEHCGLHFHVSREGVTPQAIVNLLVMTTRFKDVIFHLSRRTEANFQRWSRAYDEATELTPAIKSCIKDDTLPYCSFDRYCMVNLTNRATVEFRFFRGTLNPDSFYGSLHFINFLVEYALKCETENDITMSEIEFINQAKDHSSELKNFMEKVGL